MRRGMRNVLSASTAALCLGGLLAACGGGDGDGYVATGPAAAGPERAPGQGVAPTGDVELVPLDGESPPGKGDDRRDGSEPSDPGADGSSSDSSSKSAADEASSGSPAASGSSDSPADGAKSGRTESSSGSGSAGRSEGSGASGASGGPSGSPSAPGGSSEPSGPAKLSVGEPQRKPAADRWCEKVTVSFRNTGGSPVRSGTVTFGTHVIGALGVDWATLESTEKLPAPIGAGETVKKTWPVCVEAWRVPLGMHVETRDVSVDWK
ncbi:hypothetical protein [Streptomyces sp. NPDC051214]|uniref:hypothetical protein n=1 Tax=Streptomyces sp. NPDC051214 TaxID=3155282 RepID=UPI003437EEE7